jgi:hypothetical protein
MGEAAERYRRRQAARKELTELTAHERSTATIHYSCESFYDRADGSSPRITSLAVRNLATGQTASFSIHQIAEREHVGPAQIENEYNRLEKQMLEEFYKYAGERKDFKWLHWNMRDINYGFAALAHRFRVLGGTPVEIHESALFDLVRQLIAMFGPGYISHPRLTNLMKLNGISDKDFLTGQQEADAFNAKEYVKLHQSTLRKVDVISNIFNRTTAGTLKTNARKSEIYGSTFGYYVELFRDHPIMVVIAFAASLASIASVLLWFVSKK